MLWVLLLPIKSLSKERNTSSLVGRYGILTCSKRQNFLYYCLLPLGLSITWLRSTLSGRLIHLKSCQTHGQKKYLPSELHSQYSPLQDHHHVVLVKPAFFSGILREVKCFLFLLKIFFLSFGYIGQNLDILSLQRPPTQYIYLLVYLKTAY